MGNKKGQFNHLIHVYRLAKSSIILSSFLFMNFSKMESFQKLTEQNIIEIYESFIKPYDNNREYQNRYLKLPFEKNVFPWRWEGKDLPRVIAVLEFDRFVAQHNLSSEKGLAINGMDPEWQHIRTKKIIHISYDENPSLYDLHSLNLPDNDFDFVMCNQTLEHVYDPIRCLENIYKHMKPGGILYVNVPANNILHNLPFHYYLGYTPVGLGAVAKAAGFEIMNIGQWGNLEYLKLINEKLDWPDYRAIKNMQNQMSYPIITWVFARKK